MSDSEVEEVRFEEDQQDGDWRKGLSSSRECNIKMLELGLNSDCVIDVGPQGGYTQEFRVHRWPLMRASPVFESMFLGEMTEAITGKVRITDLTPRTFHLLLRHVYADEAEMSFKEAHDVALAADKYQMELLLEECLSRMCRKVTLQNIWTALDLLQLINHDKLRESCLKVMQTHTLEFVASYSFLQLPEDCVELLLQQDELNVESEMVLVTATVNWARREAKRRGLTGDDASVRDLLEPRLLQLLRLLTLSPEEFTMGPGYSEWLTNDEKDEIVISLIRKDYTSIPESICTKISQRQRVPSPVIVPINSSICRLCIRPVVKREKEFFNSGAEVATCVMRADDVIWLLGIEISSQVKSKDPMVLLHTSDKYKESFVVRIYTVGRNNDGERYWQPICRAVYADTTFYESSCRVHLPDIYLAKGKWCKIEIDYEKNGFYPKTVRPRMVRCEDVDFTFSTANVLGSQPWLDGCIQYVIYRSNTDVD